MPYICHANIPSVKKVSLPPPSCVTSFMNVPYLDAPEYFTVLYPTITSYQTHIYIAVYISLKL